MAILWALAYQLSYMGAVLLTQRTGAVCLVGCIPFGYILLLLRWLFGTGRAGQIRLTRPAALRLRELPAALLLLSVPVWNLSAAEAPPAWFTVLLLFSASVAEEIFFRGFLLSSLLQTGRTKGILLSSLLFACYHALHFFSAGDPLYTAVQVLFSFLAGICLGQMTLRHGSLLPGILLHFLINITGSSQTAFSPGWLAGFGLCLLCYLAAAFLYRPKEN